MDNVDGGAKLPAAVLEILTEKEGDIDLVVESALADGNILDAVQEGMVSKNETYRYNCAKVLFRISEAQPQVLYPEWHSFAEHLCSKNAYHRMASLEIIANLTSADTENRFEELFDRYFSLLNDESMIVARYLAANAGKIARAKPHLRPRITKCLLGIDATQHNPDRKDLIKFDVIQSLEELFPGSGCAEMMLAFAKAQLDCSSPKTRKAAREFLDKHVP